MKGKNEKSEPKPYFEARPVPWNKRNITGTNERQVQPIWMEPNMKTHLRLNVMISLLVVILMGAFASGGCGGSGGGGGSTSGAVSVKITPSTLTLAPGGKQTFQATVTGSSNTAVQWGCSGGTIDQTGNYTAPNASGTFVYRISATSVADSNVKAEATVNVTNAASISITPTAINLLKGGTTQFTAKITGTTDTAVTWKASAGTIDQTGFYTAPSTAGTITITASISAQPTVTATASVTVSDVVVHISPPTPSVATNQTVQFSATIDGQTSQSVTWSATGGTIDSSGLYRAGETTGTFSVTATSVTSPSYSATVSVNITAIGITVIPSVANVVIGQQQQFTANVSGVTNKSVTWTSSAGSITTSGLFTAPTTPQTVTVRAMSNADNNVSNTATVTVITSSDFFYDFNSGVPGVFTPTTNEITPSGSKFLGRISGTSPVTLTLNSITAHQTLTVSYDLFVIGGWSGISGVSTLNMQVDSTSQFLQSFSNISGENQSYPDGLTNLPGTSATSLNSLGYTHSPAILYNDAVYHVTKTFSHTAPTVTIVFTGNLTGAVSDMAWGLKNVEVKANP